MTLLLNWRVWFAIGLAVSFALIGAGGYRVGSHRVQALWDAEKVQQLQAGAIAEVENRRIETKRQTGVINAQNAQVTRNAALENDAANANSVVASLRDTIDAGVAKLPGESAAAASQYAATAAKLFLACSEALTDVSRHADGHASDSLMLQEAWPQ